MERLKLGIKQKWYIEGRMKNLDRVCMEKSNKKMIGTTDDVKMEGLNLVIKQKLYIQGRMKNLYILCMEKNKKSSRLRLLFFKIFTHQIVPVIFHKLH